MESQPMSLDRFFTNNENIFTQLSTNNIEENFALRKQIYQNRELYFEQPDEIEDTLENNEVYENINNAIVEGKVMLTQKITDHAAKTVERETTSQIKDYVDETNLDVNRMLNKIQYDVSSILSEEEKTDLHAHIDIVSFEMQSIVSIISNSTSNKIKDLNEELKNISKAIRKLSTMYGIFRHVARTCPICMTNEVDGFYDPCCHSACMTCMNLHSKKSSYCFYCRAKVNKINKIFFSM